MLNRAASVSYQGEFSEKSVELAAHELREKLGGPASLAFAFITPEYLPHLEEFVDILRVEGRILDIVGSTGTGTICNEAEHEQKPGFSVMAVHVPDAQPSITTHSAEDLQSGVDPAWLKSRVPRAEGVVLMASPFHFPADDWLESFTEAFPGIPIVGGLASGGNDESTMAVFHNGRLVEGAILVGLTGALKLVPVVSQGCRPIGEALPVTRADNNVVYSLGSRPAYQALEAAFESLTDSEKSVAQGNLFVGLANNEYIDEFKSGDFLIRNIIGADPGSGAVVIGGIPRVGQTLQYQLRDRVAADSDLKRALDHQWNRAHQRVIGSLIFSCTGRGKGMFAEAGHDATTVQSVTGTHPSAGFFCNGEIGPIAQKNCSHSYTASIALLCVKA
jgi:small ligand-binding sensory domain FIST